jgi:hypothetical protein
MLSSGIGLVELLPCARGRLASVSHSKRPLLSRHEPVSRVDVEPVGRDQPLCLGQRQHPVADLSVEETLDGVLHVRIRVGVPRLRSQVCDILGRTTELEQDQVVELVVAEALSL